MFKTAASLAEAIRANGPSRLEDEIDQRSSALAERTLSEIVSRHHGRQMEPPDPTRDIGHQLQ